MTKAALLLAGTAAAVIVSAAAGASLHIARALITPAGERPERIRILAADDATVTLHADEDTLSPGVFSLYWENRAGHARIGRILSRQPAAGTVTRALEKVYSGVLEPGTSGYWSGYTYPTPEEAGLPSSEVWLPGPAPAWLVPGDDSRRWVIHIHGLGGRRATGVRTAPLFHRLGYTQLLISFASDGDAPATTDGKHHLGHTEVDDVHAAIDYAASHGADSIILSGWSMGAAMVLAAAHTSPQKDRIDGLVLTAPVLDWNSTLSFNTAAARLPVFLSGTALRILRGPLYWLAGLNQPLKLNDLDFTSMKPEVPVLVLHSNADTSTPISVSAKYAALHPDNVTLVRFPAGRHTQEWNTDPGLWERSVEHWLQQLDQSGSFEPV